MNRGMMKLALLVVSCGSLPTEWEVPATDPAALVGEWRQIDTATGTLKVSVTANRDGTFVVDEVARGRRTAGTYSIAGSVLTFTFNGSRGERESVSSYVFVSGQTLVVGEGVLLRESGARDGIVGVWKGFERESERDVGTGAESEKTESSIVAVRADGTISMTSEKLRTPSTTAPQRSGREGMYAQVSPGVFRVTWNGESRSFLVRLVDGVALATDESIYTR